MTILSTCFRLIACLAHARQAKDFPLPGTPDAIPIGFSSIIAMKARWLSFSESLEFPIAGICSSWSACGAGCFRFAIVRFLA